MKTGDVSRVFAYYETPKLERWLPFSKPVKEQLQISQSTKIFSSIQTREFNFKKKIDLSEFNMQQTDCDQAVKPN